MWFKRNETVLLVGKYVGVILFDRWHNFYIVINVRKEAKRIVCYKIYNNTAYSYQRNIYIMFMVH